MNYIKTLRYYGKNIVSDSERNLNFIIPTKYNKNVINVLCGKNRTGKSYLLTRITRCIKNHNDKIIKEEPYIQKKISEDDVEIIITDFKSSISKLLFIDEIFKYIRYATSISIRRDSNFRRKAKSSTRVDINNSILKNSLDDFIKDSLNKLDHIEIENKAWDDSDEYRELTYDKLNIDSLYKIDEKIDFVKKFNDIVEGKLYLGKKIVSKSHPNFVIYIVYDENITLEFSRWSDGQKVLFVTALMIFYYRPNIFIFDEVENHLHPQYISFFFDYLKTFVPQSIISTHHPHIIFSKHVDKVWYLETSNNGTFEAIIKKKNSIINKAPIRKAYSLEKNIDKLAFTYKLFDNYDSQLLKLSSSTINNLNDKIAEVFKKLFHYDVVDSITKKRPDIQSEKIFQYVKSLLNKKERINILEIGAGTGRVLKELIKINADLVHHKVNWYLIEPSSIKLEAVIQDLGIENVHISNDMSSIESDIDLTLFVNVLHEIVPTDISQYIFKLQSIIGVNGDILVVELFPLIFPEKFSIPMKSSEWVGLFRALGMSVQVSSINIKNGFIEAFWLRSRWEKLSTLSYNEINNIVTNYLKDQILKNRCADYKARFEFQDLDDEMIKIMCELTSIASISSYLNNEWA